MRTLSDKEANLVRLAAYEGIDTIVDRLWTDFKICQTQLTPLQSNRFSEFEDLLYTFLCELAEDHGVLQTEYDS
jgi:hypothetical protein